MKAAKPPTEPPVPPDDAAQLTTLETDAADSARHGERKLIVLVLGVAACLAIVHLTPISHLVTDVQEWKAHIRGAGAAAPILFAGGFVALVAIGVPRLMLCTIGAVLFGFVTGALVGLFGSLFGSYGSFLFARWGGRDWVQRRVANRHRLRAMLRQPSLTTIFLVRQLPIAGIVPNLLLGMTPVPHRTFLAGTFLGYLPSTLIVALIGSGIGKGSLTHALAQMSMAMAALALLTLVVWWLRKRMPGT
jgi:uncharacterized membrane protein YdjX (TVP38/TMEM64 family)